MTEIETRPKGPRAKIRDVVKKAEPRVEPTIAAKQDRSIQIQSILQNLRKKENRKKANHSFRWQGHIWAYSGE